MNQPENFADLHENQTTSYQISGLAGTNTTTVLEEEEDPSVVNLSDYTDDDAVQSDIRISIEGGGRSPSCFSPISTNSNGTYNQFNLVTPAQLYCQASSTIQSQSSGDQASTQTQFSMSLGDLLGIFSQEAPMMQSDGENNKMAENADLNRPEESHTDEDDQDGQVS